MISKGTECSKRKYTKEEIDRAVALYLQGLTLDEIESNTGVKYSAVNKELDRRGITKRNKQAKNLECKIAELYEQGVGSYQIADRLGCSRTLVVKVADKNGIERRSTHISDEMKDKIEELYTQGKGIRIITRELNTTRQTVVHCLRSRGYQTARNASHKLTADEINDRLGDGWEYVSGYTGYYSKIVVRCTLCGEQKEVSRQHILYAGLGECKCKRIERKAAQEAEKILDFWRELQKPRPLDHVGVVKTCRHCGKPFVAEGNSSVYCSAKCRNRHHHTTRDKRIRDVADKDNISLDALIKRDGLTCWICGEPCDLEDAFWKDGVFIAGNNYPSVDHVFPLSKGGTHTWDNVRIAHRLCNTLKSDKMPPSLENHADLGSI